MTARNQRDQRIGIESSAISSPAASAGVVPVRAAKAEAYRSDAERKGRVFEDVVLGVPKCRICVVPIDAGRGPCLVLAVVRKRRGTMQRGEYSEKCPRRRQLAPLSTKSAAT